VTVKALGHLDPAGGGSRNAFGDLFGKVGAKTTGWTTALCCPDSDGDGFTNGMELGDPCCNWTKGELPANSTDLSHPSVAFSKPLSRKTPSCVATVCKAFREQGTSALRGAQ
jgi:hypothetical protein